MTLHAKGQTLVIQGGRPLRGDVAVGGSKNATLGAMAACLLVTDDCILENVPEIDDVEQMALVLRSLGRNRRVGGAAHAAHQRRRRQQDLPGPRARRLLARQLPRDGRAARPLR